jgi:hypothetical protein
MIKQLITKTSRRAHYLSSEVSRFYPLIPLARNLREEVSVIIFIVKFTVAFFLQYRFHRDDMAIHLQGAKYTVGLGSGEVGTFE